MGSPAEMGSTVRTASWYMLRGLVIVVVITAVVHFVSKWRATEPEIDVTTSAPLSSSTEQLKFNRHRSSTTSTRNLISDPSTDQIDKDKNLERPPEVQAPTDNAKIAVAASTGRKWIVVTSVQHPTENVKRLASYPGWTLVVVADMKTPTDWHLDGVHFLSVDKQKEMAAEKYASIAATPYKSYTRKNIGYLYAIANGAEWIYDTDDDNVPTDRGLDEFDYGENVSGLRFQLHDNCSEPTMNDRLFNPYRHFGQSAMWPRGFPLDSIQDHSHKDRSYRLCSGNKRPAVQQGIVKKDPDVDAVYRLLHADKENGLNEDFHRFAPAVILSPGTYSPWNSQNTLFHRDAFFGLFLPTSVAFRVTDIWRSYFSQALLHLLDETISFVPVNAIQARNAHDYLSDFQQESAVYEQSGAMVKFLSNWTCSDDLLEVCMHNLAIEFSSRGFWTDADTVLVQKWILDLKKAGYIFPVFHGKNEYDYRIHLPAPKDFTKTGVFENIPYERRARNCRQAHFHAEMTLPRDGNDAKNLLMRAEQKINDFSDIQEWCGESENNRTKKWTFPSSTQLAQRMGEREELLQKYKMVAVITSNYPWRMGAGLLQRLYKSSFGLIIFCGTWDPEQFGDSEKHFPGLRTPVNYIHTTETEMNKGTHAYICLNKVAEMRLRNVEGYVMFSDDAIINPWYRFDVPKIYSNPRFFNDENMDRASNGAAEKSVDLLLNKYANRSDVQASVTTYEGLLKAARISYNGTVISTIKQHLMTRDAHVKSDLIYIPASNMSFITTLGEVFYEAGLFHDIFLNKVLAVLPNRNEWTEPTETHAVMEEKREHWDEVYNDRIAGLHTIKISELANKTGPRTRFCDSVLDVVHRNHMWK